MEILVKSLLDARPVVGSHLQKATDGHAQPDSPSVTQQDVQDHLVPPALRKVRQQVHEEQLRGGREGGGDLEKDRRKDGGSKHRTEVCTTWI